MTSRLGILLGLLALAAGIGLTVWLLPPRAIERRLLKTEQPAPKLFTARAPEPGLGMVVCLPHLGALLGGWQADRRITRPLGLDLPAKRT